MNDVVVSRYSQSGDIRQCVSSRCPPPEEKTKPLDNYMTATKTNHLGMLVMAGILVSRLHLGIRVQSSKTTFLSIRIVKPVWIE